MKVSVRNAGCHSFPVSGSVFWLLTPYSSFVLLYLLSFLRVVICLTEKKKICTFPDLSCTQGRPYDRILGSDV